MAPHVKELSFYTCVYTLHFLFLPLEKLSPLIFLVKLLFCAKLNSYTYVYVHTYLYCSFSTCVYTYDSLSFLPFKPFPIFPPLAFFPLLICTYSLTTYVCTYIPTYPYLRTYIPMYTLTYVHTHAYVRM